MARASRSKRSLKGPRLVLMATSRFRRVSRAFQTSPIPPAPRADRISYGPSRVPGARGMEVLGIIERRELVRSRRRLDPRGGGAASSAGQSESDPAEDAPAGGSVPTPSPVRPAPASDTP